MKFRISVILLIFAVILSFFLKADWWIYPILILIFGLLTFLGVVNMDFNWFLKNKISANNTSEKKIALTFDDGPTEITPKFLELLEKFDQKATFFCIGKQIEKYPEILIKTYEKGHEIGNHSFSHSNKTGFLSTGEMISEIEKNDVVIERNLGFRPKIYRPPFGITNPNIAKAVRKTEKKSIGWNIRSFDTAISDEQKILKRIIPNIKPGSIILLHDTSKKTLHVLEQILLFLQRENYRSVTVSELLNLNK